MGAQAGNPAFGVPGIDATPRRLLTVGVLHLGAPSLTLFKGGAFA